MKTMTIRNIPNDVTQGVIDSAEARHVSMNAAVIALLSAGLGIGRSRKKHDFSTFCGGWSAREHADFEKATARKINPEDWQ